MSGKILTGIILVVALFAQTDKGNEHPQPPPKKFANSFILDPAKNQSQFHNQFDNDEIVHVPGYSQRNNYSWNNRDTPDTLAYDLEWGAYFYMLPDDVMMTVFQMPANGIIKGVNVPVYRWGTGEQLTVALYATTYPFGSDTTMYDQSFVNGTGWLAGYDDNNDGHMELEGSTYNAAAGVCGGSAMIPNAQDPLGNEQSITNPPEVPSMGLIWPDGFTAATLNPVDNPGIDQGGGDNWIHTVDFGSEPELEQGDWVGIAVRYSGTGGDGSDPGIGFQYAAGTSDPWKSMKFYADSCNGTGGENGWYIRHYVFNFQLAVELTGDRGPQFFQVPSLPTTLSTDSLRVITGITDDNPSGGDAGVDHAQFIYQLDSLTAPADTIAMVLFDGDNEYGLWETYVPGQEPGHWIYWKLRAVDVNGNNTETETLSYTIFPPPTNNDLIFNNQELVYGNLLYSSYLYLYWGGEGFDIWDASYGPMTDELLQNYDVLIELTGGGGPIYINDDEVEEWWNGEKTYIVTGDEWLGARFWWDVYLDGIALEILGLTLKYVDINYTTSGDQAGISRLIPDSVGVTRDLYEFLADSLFLNYDPNYETGNSNWLDGFDIVDGYTVDMTAYSGVLDSNGNVADDAEIYNVMVHGQAGNGGKSAFLAFDPIGLNTTPVYYWVGASSYYSMIGDLPYNASPLVSVYEALQGIVSVEDEAEIPKSFSLKNNYPNPFNPVTNIHYELYKNMEVKITIYDLLGRKVKHLVNAHQTAGEKTVQWNGTNDLGQPVSAGVYFYKVETPEKQITKKMAVLK